MWDELDGVVESAVYFTHVMASNFSLSTSCLGHFTNLGVIWGWSSSDLLWYLVSGNPRAVMWLEWYSDWLSQGRYVARVVQSEW